MNGCLIIIMATALSGLPVDFIPGTESQPGETVSLGAVRFEAATATIHLDGFFNMSQGFVEYLSCISSLFELVKARNRKLLLGLYCLVLAVKL